VSAVYDFRRQEAIVMSEETNTTPQEADPEKASKKKRKKQQKARGVWISFGGRIVAQVVGAAATIFLGILLVQKGYGPSADKPTNDAPSVIRDTASQKSGHISVAVLPLDNFSPDPNKEYFADGMTEALIAGLAQFDGLRVISRTSVMQFKRQSKSIPEIAQQLAVDMVVEGSVIEADDRVRVTAQLIDGKTDEHLWSETFDRPLRNILTLQSEIATTIAKKINTALIPPTNTTQTEQKTVDPKVYDLYLKGRHAWSMRTRKGLEQAVPELEAVVKLDPNFAPAYAALGDTYSHMGFSAFGMLSPNDAFTKATASAQRALQLDDNSSEAHTALGLIQMRYAWDWPGANRSFTRALQLNPSYETARQWYALYLAEQGRDSEAQTEANRLLELDPLSSTTHRIVGSIHYYGRRYDLSEQSLRRAVELEPNSVATQIVLSRPLISLGKFAEVIDILERVPQNDRPDELICMLGYAYAQRGNRRRADELRRQLENRRPPAAPGSLVRLYIGLGDTNAAFNALDAAIRDRSDVVSVLKVSPLFDDLRRDRRFGEALRKANLS